MKFAIPLEELQFRATRAGGPGGQHVNTASSRIEVRWDIAASRGLSDALRARLLSRLANRLDSRGVVRVVASARRSQLQNRQAALARLQELVDAALREPKPRRPTRPSAAARERRLEVKRHRSTVKRTRVRADPDD